MSNEGQKSKGNDILLVGGACSAALLAAYALFLFSIKRRYVKTFFSTKTGFKFDQEDFTNFEDDEHKMGIFDYGEHQWRKDIGEEVRVWLNERLEGWLDTDPSWFTDVYKASIPEWIVNDNNLFQRLRSEIEGADAKVYDGGGDTVPEET